MSSSPQRTTTIFFSVGEPSGDLHGANLIRQLHRLGPVRCGGFGGPRLAAAGCELHADLTQLAVMWITRAIVHLHRFWQLLRQADGYFRDHRPDAVVLIDYPGFNWWIARAAKRHNVPVLYYGAPQLWAWAPWRIGKMRRLVDHVLCKLPFERQWYVERQCDATYVGHPFFDETCSRRLDATFLHKQRRKAGPLVAILPGSRMQEVKGNLRWFLKSAAHVHRQAPAARFAVASYNEAQAEMARALVASSGLPIEVHVGRTAELIEASHCCMACSGSVSLELLHHTRPTVILYHITPIAMVMQALLRRVRYITLVNLLTTDDPQTRDPRPFDPDAPGAAQVPFPEYLTCRDKSTRIAAWIVRWLTDPDAYRRRVELLTQIRDDFGSPGASATAAAFIWRRLHDTANRSAA